MKLGSGKVNVILSGLVMCLCSGWLGGFAGRVARQPDSYRRGESQDARRFPCELEGIELGTMKPGGKVTRCFTIRNRGREVVEIEDIVSSCECVQMELVTRRIAVGEVATGRIVADLKDEPKFHGRLAVEVRGRGRKGEDVFSTQIKVAVE
jgi:hypothetical protein